MKKVLIIAGALYIGGAERVARDIGFYAGDRFEVHYLVFGDRIGEYEKQLTSADCKIIHTAAPSNGHLAHYRFLCQLIRQEQYDVVHSHTMFNSGWAMLAGKRCGVPVRIAHSHSALEVRQTAGKKLYEFAMRQMILRCATHYVACGEKAGVRLYGEKAYQKAGITLLNGIDTDSFRFSAQTRETIRKDMGLQNCFVIGHVGHLAEVKNQSFLISLMPEILKRRKEAVLLLLGEGDDRPKLEALIQKLGLKNKVIMAGNVSNVNEYLSAMDVFAFPSLYEGMPLSIVEVQANGLPCVISDRVPRDVFVTDLLKPQPLENEAVWTEAILDATRTEPEKYAGIVRDKGLDSRSFLEKVYQLYDSSDREETAL